MKKAILLLLTIPLVVFIAGCTNQTTQTGYVAKTCTDECSYNGKYCEGDKIYDCGNTDDDNCKEKTLVKYCGSNEWCAEGKCCGNTKTPYTETEYYTETVPYTDKECENKVLVYSITDFVLGSQTCNKQEEVCNKYILGICTSKTVYCVDRSISCSLKVNNLDSERGYWDIKFNFFKVGNNSVVATDTDSIWLYPQTSGIVTGTGKITTKELLDTSYTCTYTVSNEPTKEICKDVTKYREVQKSREVTKYKDEVVCS